MQVPPTKIVPAAPVPPASGRLLFRGSGGGLRLAQRVSFGRGTARRRHAPLGPGQRVRPAIEHRPAERSIGRPAPARRLCRQRLFADGIAGLGQCVSGRAAPQTCVRVFRDCGWHVAPLACRRLRGVAICGRYRCRKRGLYLRAAVSRIGRRLPCLPPRQARPLLAPLGRRVLPARWTEIVVSAEARGEILRCRYEVFVFRWRGQFVGPTRNTVSKPLAQSGVRRLRSCGRWAWYSL